MFDILTDSVFDIAQAQYNAAYGGRKVVDFYETPCNLTMIRTESVRPDAHVEIKSHVHEDLASVSAIPGFGDIFHEGENKSSHTRNPFRWTHEDLSLTGVFGSAVKNYGKVMAILYAKNLPVDNFDTFFRNEWGIHPGADLSAMIPTLVGTDQMAFAAIVENRTPDVFIHPNYTGDSEFVWHDINRQRLSSRAGRPIGCDFAKCRAYGEFQTRVLRNESSVPLDQVTRLEYHLNLDEMPPPASLNAFPVLSYSCPPSGVIMTLIQSAVVLIEAHAVEHAAEVVQRMHDSAVIVVPDDYGPLDLVQDAVIPTARLDASNFRINEFLHRPADNSIFGADLRYNTATIKEYRKDKNKRVVVGTNESHWMLDIILPLPLANDMKSLCALDASSALCYRYLTGFYKCNFMGNLKLIGHITHGTKLLGDAFARRILTDWGFNSVDFHHRKGDDILISAFSRQLVRENVLATLKNVCKIRSHRLLNRSMIVSGFFLEWKRRGNFEMALDAFFKLHRSRWVKRFKDRAYLAANKEDKVVFQLRATIFAKVKVHWAQDVEPFVTVSNEDLVKIIAVSHRNYARKRLSKVDMTELQIAENTVGYVYQCPYARFELVQDAMTFFDMTFNPVVTMTSIVNGLTASLDALADDVKCIFEEIQTDVSERRISAAGNFEQSFEVMEDELTDVSWAPPSRVMTAPEPLQFPVDDGSDPFDSFAALDELHDIRATDKTIPLSEALNRLYVEGLPRGEEFSNWVYASYPAFVSEVDIADIINNYHRQGSNFVTSE